MTQAMDIEPHHLAIVLDILKQHLPQNTLVWVFGSRVGKTKKKYSDLDLAMDAKKPLSYEVIVDLKHSFEESDLPYKVDLVDWHTIDKEFQKQIRGYNLLTSILPERNNYGEPS